MRTVHELAQVFYDCFSNLEDTEDYVLLHDDTYVTKTLKKHLGSKRFKEYDELDQSEWRDAWSKYNQIIKRNK